MKEIIKISLLLILLALTGCSKSPKCWGEDKKKGQIENFELPDCYCAEMLPDDSYIIQDIDELDPLTVVLLLR